MKRPELDYNECAALVFIQSREYELEPLAKHVVQGMIDASIQSALSGGSGASVLTKQRRFDSDRGYHMYVGGGLVTLLLIILLLMLVF